MDRASDGLPSRLLKLEQVQERLMLGRSSVYKLVGSGQLEVVRLGRSVRVPEDALVALIERLRG
jgi:excisionase family DNA binding protein